MYRKYFKRIFDLIIALTILLIFSLLLIVVMILIKIDSPGPIFYIQSRLGKSGEIFNLIKFRTMYNRSRVPNREILPGDNEVTRLGKHLRRYKMDEIPQLFNVIIGNLSLVGPRPSLESLQNEFDENGVYRILVKPGLTGLAQINGNIYLSWKERWKYDRQYVENYSFYLDVKIIVKTILVILFGELKYIKRPPNA